MLAAESPQTNTVDKTIDYSSASKPVPNELGKLIIIKKEGGEGAVFDISTDITIGRDKECDIRIKLNSISRQHARIFIDENGEYHLHHLSKTNPSLVNGAPIKDTCILRDGDELTFGDRLFKFSRPSSRPIKQHFSASKVLSVEKHVPSLETIDERHTFDFSRAVQQTHDSSSSVSPVMNMTTPNKEAVPIVDTVNAEQPATTVAPTVEKVQDVEAEVMMSPPPSAKKRKAAINTPTRQAIQSLRRSSLDTPSVNSDSIETGASDSAAKTPVKSATKASRTSTPHKAAPKEEEVSSDPVVPVVSAVLNTPTRKAIKALRKSTGGSSSLSQEKEQHEEQQQPEKMAVLINTPLKNAIKSMRKSYSAPPAVIEKEEVVAVVQEEVMEVKVEVEVEVEAAVVVAAAAAAPSKQTLKTPLKKAIQALRKNDVGTPVVKDQEKEEAVAARGSAAVNAHLLRAIQARRKSGGVAAGPSTASGSEAASVSSGVAMNANLLKAIQARRKSGAGVTAAAPALAPAAAPVASTTSSVAMNSHLLKAIQARRKSGVGATAVPTIAVAAAPSLQSALKAAIQSKASQFKSTSVPAPVSITSSASSLSSDLMAAIQSRRRKSVTAAPAAVKTPSKPTTSTPSAAGLKRKLATPLRMAIQQLSNSTADSAVSAPETPVAPVVPSASSAVKSTIKKTATPTFSSKKGRANTPIASSDKPEASAESVAVEEFLSDVLSASKMQMTASVMAAEMIATTEGTSAATAADLQEQLEVAESFSVTRVLFELNSDANEKQDEEKEEKEEEEEDLGMIVDSIDTVSASPAITSPCVSRKRGRESLLGSLQKKATAACTASIDSLTESEMALIENYASQLEKLEVVDPEEAYAMALDSYLQGIELCHSEIAETETETKAQAVTLEESKTVIDAAAAAPTAPKAVGDASFDFSGSLRSLFSLPLSFTDASDDSRDEQLVEQYAALMTSCCSSLSVSIAFGVALDSFLADPVGFRHRVGHLPLPCEPPVAIRAPEMKATSDAAPTTSPAVVKSAKKQPRKSLSVTTKVEEPEVNSNISVPSKSMINTPLKNAIKSMRKSYSAPPAVIEKEEVVAVVQEEVMEVKVEVEVEAAVVVAAAAAAPSKQTLKTPLKKAIQALRKNDVGTPTVTASVSASPEAVMKTPTAGRKRSRLSEAAAVPLPATPATAAKNHTAAAAAPEEEKKEEVAAESVLPSVTASEAEVEAPVTSEAETVTETGTTTTTTMTAVVVAETETAAVDSEKINRKVTKKSKKEVTPVQSEPAVPSSPARKKRSAEEAEVMTEQEVEPSTAAPAAPVANKTAAGRKKAARASIPEEEVKEVQQQPTEEVTVTAVAAPATGGRKRKQQTEAVATTSVPEVQVEEVLATEPVKPSRRGAKAVEQEEKEEEAPIAAATPASKRSKKATEPVEPVAAASAPAAKKGKKAAVAAPVLQEDEEEALAILCDGCDKEYFVDEVGLKAVPKGDWFCAKCVDKNSKKQQQTKGGKVKAATATAEAPAAVKGRAKRG